MSSFKKIFVGLLILIIGGVIGYFIARGTMTPSAGSVGASVYGINSNGSTGPTNPGCPTGVPCDQTVVVGGGSVGNLKDGDACSVGWINSNGGMSWTNGTWSTKTPPGNGCIITISYPASNNNNTKSLVVPNGGSKPDLKIGDPCTVVGPTSSGTIGSWTGSWALTNSGGLYCKIAIHVQPNPNVLPHYLIGASNQIHTQSMTTSPVQ